MLKAYFILHSSFTVRLLLVIHLFLFCLSLNVGRGSAIKAKWALRSDSTFISEVSIPQKLNFAHVIRLEKRFCGNKLLEEIVKGKNVRFGIGSKASSSKYQIESITYPKVNFYTVKAKQSSLVKVTFP